MDREKMIEETAKALESIAVLGWIGDRKVEEHAKELVDIKIYKIPEGSVVLTREEYSQLKNKVKWARELGASADKIRTETAREILRMLQPCDICIRTNCINCVKVEIKEKYGVEVK